MLGMAHSHAAPSGNEPAAQAPASLALQSEAHGANATEPASLTVDTAQANSASVASPLQQPGTAKAVQKGNARGKKRVQTNALDESGAKIVRLL
jgi:hypothetical protein